MVVLLVSCWLHAGNSLAESAISSKTDESIAKRSIASQPAKANKPVVYKVGNDRIESKPRLKYELIISLHVLKFAEDHHQLFILWAQQMRKDLSEKTLHEVTVLIENAHEWQLSSLVEGYDGSDTIDELVEFIKGAGENEVIKRAQLDHLVKKLDLNTKEFSVWYADFLKRYYEEGFRKQWFYKYWDFNFFALLNNKIFIGMGIKTNIMIDMTDN